MTIVQTTFNGQQYLRDRQVILRSELSDYMVQIVVKGSVVGDFPPANLKANAGDIFILDFNRPYLTRAEAGSRIAFSIPREPLERIIGRKNLHGFVFQSHWPITRVLTDYLLGLNAVAADLSLSESGAIQDALLTLLAGALAGREMTPSAASSELNGVLRQSILDYIDRHIADHDLGPQKLMERFRISRTHLYRIFEAEGGVATLVREKRLDLAYRLLVSPSASAKKDSESIKRLCFQCGFSSPEHFSRAFKERFGMTPNNLKMSESRSKLLQPGRFDLHEYLKTYSSSNYV